MTAAALSSFPVSELFNSILPDSISDSVYLKIKTQKNNVPSSKIKYKAMPKNLPAIFDPRTPDGVPMEDRKTWFYKDFTGALIPIINFALIDQAGCGSGWAFAAAGIFTDAIRLNISRIYGDKACQSSQFFRAAFICTGNSSIEDNGVIAKRDLLAIDIRDTISPYYTVAFSPRCSIDNNPCNETLGDWKNSFIKDIKPTDIKPECIGCQGNIVPCSLMLFTDINGGAPLISNFPIHEWACFFGSVQQRELYCSPEYISGNVGYVLPRLYNADRYSYCTSRDLENKQGPENINDMTDWIMATIYNYGPCVISFQIYTSFLKFFRGKFKKSIYTAQIFIDDIEKNDGTAILGGHAVAIVGWGEVPSTLGENLKYWIVRNSWGKAWGDDGFFRIERNIDLKLKNAKLDQRLQFETDFGALYFAPYPNEDLFAPDGKPRVNDMKNFLQSVPNTTCDALDQFPNIIEEMGKDCNCRCGSAYNNTLGKCDKMTKLAGSSHAHAHAHAHAHKYHEILVFMLVLLLLLLLVIFIKYSFPPLFPQDYHHHPHSWFHLM
jgi:hypothetical protein